MLVIDLIEHDDSLGLESYQAAILIDHRGTTVKQIVSALKSANVPGLLIVDHHESQDRLEPEISEIRKAGSTATIYTNYLQQAAMHTARRACRDCSGPFARRRTDIPAASQMLAAGMSVLSLQRYVGHENLTTTLVYAEVSDPILQKDYYRGAATFDPASSELARRILALSQRDQLRQLIAELKYPELEPKRRKRFWNRWRAFSLTRSWSVSFRKLSLQFPRLQWYTQLVSD